MNRKDDYIAVFDSGVGGISVLKALQRLMPEERYLYFGDSANAPYGSRSTREVRSLTLAAAEKLGAEVYMPPLSLCGDNGAMIGAQAYYEYMAGNVADMSLNAYATKSILGEAL